MNYAHKEFHTRNNHCIKKKSCLRGKWQGHVVWFYHAFVRKRYIQSMSIVPLTILDFTKDDKQPLRVCLSYSYVTLIYILKCLISNFLFIKKT